MTTTRAPKVFHDLLTRCIAKIEVDIKTGCWLWTASRDGGGYGQVMVDGKPRKAHRMVYEQIAGPIPEGLQLDHLCRVRHCVNPAHLEPVTHRENSLRGVGIAAQQARKTHCENGHEFTDENTIRYTTQHGTPGRRCRTCSVEWNRQRYAARFAPAAHEAANVVPCPSCGARAGERCRDGGVDAVWPHKIRRYAARKAAA